MTGSLSGLRVVNTRAAHQAAALDRLLLERGATPIAYPCIAIIPPTETAELDRDLHKLAGGEFDWLVFTSANTVIALASRLDELGMRVPADGQMRVAAVGPATARSACELLGVAPALVPDTHTGVELARAIPMRQGERVLLPLSKIADEDVARGLRERGAEVTESTAYRTVIGHGGADLTRLLPAGEVDALTFCSPSAVDGFIKRLAREGGSLEIASALPVICIGPSSHSAAVQQGFTSVTTATTHTLEGLVAALDESVSIRA